MDNEMSYGELVQRDANKTIEWFEDKTDANYDGRQKLVEWIINFEPSYSFYLEMPEAIAAQTDAEIQMAFREFNQFIQPQCHSGRSFGMMMRLIQRHYQGS